MREFNLDNYVTVSDRIKEFWFKYPEGRIITEITHLDTSEIKNRMVVVLTSIFLNKEDLKPTVTGWAKEREGTFGANKTSFIENAETSSIGRALANLGLLVEKNRASREEMQAVQASEKDHSKVLEEIKNLVSMFGDDEVKAETKRKWKELKDSKIEAEDYLGFLIDTYYKEIADEEENK